MHSKWLQNGSMECNRKRTSLRHTSSSSYWNQFNYFNEIETLFATVDKSSPPNFGAGSDFDRRQSADGDSASTGRGREEHGNGWINWKQKGDRNRCSPPRAFPDLRRGRRRGKWISFAIHTFFEKKKNVWLDVIRRCCLTHRVNGWDCFLRTWNTSASTWDPR